MKLLDLLNRAIVVLASIALILASGVLTYSVVLRYFSPEPTDWQDEFAVFLLVGVTFGAAAWVQSQECPDGTMATPARGHENITRCLPI